MHRLVLVGWAVGIVVVLGSALGCSPRLIVGDRCDNTSTCAEPLVCRLGRCRTECTRQRDCPIGAECVIDAMDRGSCRLPDDARCASNAECETGLICVEGACANACVSVTECPEGSVCEASSDGRTRCLRQELAIGDSGIDDGGTDAPVADGGVDVGVDAPDANETCDVPPCDAVLDVAMSERGVCARTESGAVWCWGFQLFLGTGGVAPDVCDGSSVCATRPMRVRYDDPATGPRDLAEATALAGNRDVTCAIVGGRVACWGRVIPLLGGPGDGSVARPVRRASGFIEEAERITVSAEAALAWTTGTDTILGWGSAPFGEFGEGIEAEPRDRAEAVDPFPGGMHLALGGWHGCGIAPTSRVSCWGENDLGQSGGATVGAGAVLAPVAEVPGGPDEVIDVQPGRGHTCALTAGGDVWCWGSHVVGPNDVSPCVPGADRLACPPREMFRSGSPFTTLAVSPFSESACAIDGAGALWCWGGDSYVPEDVVGGGDPRRVMGLPPVARAYLGGGVACAIDREGALWCWGENEQGQLGRGTFFTTPDRTPMPVSWSTP